jgi:hypothetical protein
MSISTQFDIVVEELERRDRTGNSDPVLVTITIGANDIGVDDPETLRQIIRWSTIIRPKTIFPDIILLAPPQSGVDFFEWLDDKSASIDPSLTSGIDRLLSHENVHIVLTDYPNPFRIGGFGPCNDFFLSLSCEAAMGHLLGRLNSIMLDQFLRVGDPNRLRVATLGSSFTSHYSDCAPLAPSANASETWFQLPSSFTGNLEADLYANMDACFHPNETGARGIADDVVPLVYTLLTPQLAQTSAAMDIGATGPNGHEIGARFTVTHEDGEYIGECTLEGNGDEPYPISCRVDVPRGTTVVVTLDVTTITPGYVPVENPISFDTSSDPGAASHWGVGFQLEPQGATSGSTWPTDSDDGPGTLFVWLGANMYGFPDWVACDDTTTYCLVGYHGGEHMLVQMSGLDVVGEVADSATDPRGELLALGLSDATVIQILGQHSVSQGGTTGDTGTGGDATTGDQEEDAQVIVPIEPQNGARVPAGSEEETWTASFTVYLCDLPPNSGPDMNCLAEGGVVVDISLASGEWLGSCAVGEPQPTLWDTFMSTCAVEGMPFNADFVATQDPFTIPAGNEPSEDSISLRVDNLVPGGGDQTTFTFYNVRTDAGSAGSAGSPGTAGEATLLMTFRACPEGFVPDVDDPFVDCTIPLDAPDASVVGIWGEDSSLVPITSLERQYNGEYIYYLDSSSGYLELRSLDPVLRDDFLIYGVDDQDGSSYITLLDNGETHEIFIFYYYA